MSTNKEILGNRTTPRPPEPYGQSKHTLPQLSTSTSTTTGRSSSLPRSLQGPRLWRSPGPVRTATSKGALTSKAATTAATSRAADGEDTAGKEKKASQEKAETRIETEKERKPESIVENDTGTGNDLTLVVSDSRSAVETEVLNEESSSSTAPSMPADDLLQEAPTPDKIEAGDAGVVRDVGEESGCVAEENHATQEEERLSFASDTEDVPIAEMEAEAAAVDDDMSLPSPPPELSPSVWNEGIPDSYVESPPLPPPLPPPPPPPPPLEAGPVPARGGLLADIHKGVSLREVPQEVKERPTGPAEVKVVDVQSELRNKFLKRTKEKVQVMKSEIDQHQQRIDQVKQWIVDAQHNHSSLSRLQMLLDEVKDVQTLVNTTTELMRQRTSWPAELVDHIVVIVDFLTAFQQQVVKLEQLCSTAVASSEGADAVAAPVNTEAVWTVVKGIVLKVRTIQDAGSRYAQAALRFTVSSSDVGDLISRASDATMSLLNVMFPRAMQSVDSVYETGLSRYDQTFRVSNAHRLLTVCCQLNDNAVIFLNGVKHALYSDAQLRIKDMEDAYSQPLNVSRRSGEWDAVEQVKLRSSSESRSVRSRRMSAGTHKNLVEVVRAGNAERVSVSLQECSNVQSFQAIEKELLMVAAASGNCQVIGAVMQHRQSLSLEPMNSSRQFDIIHEAIVKSKLDCISHLVRYHGFSINCKSAEAGNLPLHIAARRPDFVALAFLIRLGADLMAVNYAGRNVLQLLAVKEFPQVSCPNVLETAADSHLNLLSYVNNPSLSDVVLVSEEDGENREKFFAHRVILCAQSEVFKAMMESPHWSVAKQKEIVLHDVRPAVMSVLLQYVYTGSCLFPRDDLNLGIELLAAADRYLLFPMKRQCEAVLAEKIDSEVVVPLYNAAFRFNAQILLSNCCHFLLENYQEIDDPDHTTLLHVLENAQPRQSQGRAQPYKPAMP